MYLVNSSRGNNRGKFALLENFFNTFSLCQFIFYIIFIINDYILYYHKNMIKTYFHFMTLTYIKNTNLFLIFFSHKLINILPHNFSMGYNGRDCVLRTLCESRQYFQRNKMNMIGEMLRVIFRYYINIHTYILILILSLLSPHSACPSSAFLRENCRRIQTLCTTIMPIGTPIMSTVPSNTPVTSRYWSWLSVNIRRRRKIITPNKLQYKNCLMKSF